MSPGKENFVICCIQFLLDLEATQLFGRGGEQGGWGRAGCGGGRGVGRGSAAGGWLVLASRDGAGGAGRDGSGQGGAAPGGH